MTECVLCLSIYHSSEQCEYRDYTPFDFVKKINELEKKLAEQKEEKEKIFQILLRPRGKRKRVND